MHYFILSLFLLNLTIADPELTQKFIEAIKSGKFTYNPDTRIVQCVFEDGISGLLKLRPDMSLENAMQAVQSGRIKYHGPINHNLARFTFDENIGPKLLGALSFTRNTA